MQNNKKPTKSAQFEDFPLSSLWCLDTGLVERDKLSGKAWGRVKVRFSVHCLSEVMIKRVSGQKRDEPFDGGSNIMCRVRRNNREFCHERGLKSNADTETSAVFMLPECPVLWKQVLVPISRLLHPGQRILRALLFLWHERFVKRHLQLANKERAILSRTKQFVGTVKLQCKTSHTCTLRE